MVELIHKPYVVFFIIILVGSLLGKIKVKSIGLGSSAIIFPALLAGHFGASLSPTFEDIGLIIFIFSVGIQAGPGFFDSFKTKEAFQYIFPVFLTIFLIAFLTTVLCKILGLPQLMIAGVFTGITTSTASLAAITESSHSITPILGYSIAYPISIVSTVIFLKILPSYLKLDVKNEIASYQSEIEKHYPKIYSRNFVVVNPNIVTKNLSDLNVDSVTGARVITIRKSGGREGVAPENNLQLSLGDQLKAVGSKESLKSLELLIGPKSKEQIKVPQKIKVRWILVTQKKMIGICLSSLKLDQNWSAYISRLRRAGIDIVPNSNTRLRFGDKIQVSVPALYCDSLTKALGGVDSRKTDFIPISLSIVLGILIGQIQFPFLNSSVGPGIAGGILMTTLLLGRLGKTGPILWSIPESTNDILREIGILFFLSGVGIRTGKHLTEVISIEGLKIAVVSIFTVLFTLTLTTFIVSKTTKMNRLKLLGTLAGSMTCAPALAGINEDVNSSIPGTAYSISFPFALLATILVAQLLLYV